MGTTPSRNHEGMSARQKTTEKLIHEHDKDVNTTRDKGIVILVEDADSSNNNNSKRHSMFDKIHAKMQKK